MVTVLRRSRVPYTLGLVAIGAAFLSQTANTTAARGPSCPLPVGRQVKAVKAFLEIMPVFQHPRCFNCHGGVNPFIKKTGPDPADKDAPASTVAHGLSQQHGSPARWLEVGLDDGSQFSLLRGQGCNGDLQAGQAELS
jgi:hypothetical protein